MTTTDPGGRSAAVDADFVETTGSTLATRTAAPVTPWVPTFAVAVDEAIERKREKRRFFLEVMEEGLHYGVIPGTGEKPALYKAGAEMLLSNMGLNPSLDDAEPAIVDVTGADHGGEAYIRYRKACRIYRQTGPNEHDRMLVAKAEGSCSSWETKYRYRNDQRKCPECGKAAIIVGKPEYGGGFVCFKRKDGCGAKFKDNDPAITGQVVGKIANPDVAELENTILKMADKRALVAATLIATGCSDIFTQDVEDAGAGDPPERTETARAASQSDESLLGASQERTEALDVVARGWAALGLTTDAEYAQRVAQVGDPNTPWDELSMLELTRLGKVLAREYRERGAKPEPVQCPECTGIDGEHLDDDLGPCILDNSDRALRIRAGEASAERYPELRQESML